jgi:hypothetical protein
MEPANSVRASLSFVPKRNLILQRKSPTSDVDVLVEDNGLLGISAQSPFAVERLTYFLATSKSG